MKVLFIQSYSKNFRPILPAGLARIAASIQDKNEIAVFDPNIEPNVKGKLIKTLKTFDPDVVGISLRSVDSVDYIGREYFYPDFIRFLNYIRRVKPKVKIVVGGGGFSLFAKEIMQENPYIDAGVFLKEKPRFPSSWRIWMTFIKSKDSLFETGIMCILPESVIQSIFQTLACPHTRCLISRNTFLGE